MSGRFSLDPSSVREDERAWELDRVREVIDYEIRRKLVRRSVGVIEESLH